MLFQSSLIPFKDVTAPTIVPFNIFSTNSLRGISLESTLRLRSTLIHHTGMLFILIVKLFGIKKEPNKRMENREKTNYLPRTCKTRTYNY